MATRKTQPTGRAVARSRSLDEFTKDKQRADCPVCRLPAAVQEQIWTASAKRIQVAVVCEWLQEEHGLTVTPAEFIRHARGAHGWKRTDGTRQGSRRR